MLPHVKKMKLQAGQPTGSRFAKEPQTCALGRKYLNCALVDGGDHCARCFPFAFRFQSLLNKFDQSTDTFPDFREMGTCWILAIFVLLSLLALRESQLFSSYVPCKTAECSLFWVVKHNILPKMLARSI